MRTIKLDQSRASWSYSKAPSPSDTPQELLSPEVDQLAQLDSYRPCTQSPSQIHAELNAANKIPDPFKRRNEELVQWVGEEDWIYRCTFELDRLPSNDEQADLVFEGLDTFATVFLNGRKILEVDNMFTPFRVRVTSDLKDSNEMYIIFRSAFKRGRQLEEEHLGRGNHWPAWNGDPSRLFVRKAGFNYGWDWGPVLMTAGPWKPIRLETYRSRIYDFWPQAVVDADLRPLLRLSYRVSDALPSHSLNVAVVDPDGVSVASRCTVDLQAGEMTIDSFSERGTKLWYPCGMGKQHLYTIELCLVDEKTGSVIDSVKRKVGFRRLEIVQEPLIDAPGTSFCFRINNLPTFIGGSNWIPIDSILSNATEERYRKWLELLVEGNQRMVRVWGGGIYEDDVFYEICDELGILVWQDFMFACGAYPAHPEFLESVKDESTANVKRLRTHPCLALFAGNNEDYQIAESEKLDYDPNDHDGDWTKSNFPAREIYERLLPSIVAEHSNVFYWPGSPFGGSSTRDTTVGDIHQWDVWHGAQAPYQDYDKLSGRFVSEFGMEAAPDIRTVDYLLDGDSSESFPQSRTMDAHNKAGGHARRLASYIAENIRSEDTLGGYIYATQFIQAEALSTAFSSWRRLFKGGVERAYCSGALVWQLNDVWPCTSWSIVDYFMRPKPSYFAIKRALAPIALGSKRYTKRTNTDPYSAISFIEEVYVDFWVGNSRLEEVNAKLVVEAFELSSGKSVFREARTVKLRSNCSSDLFKMKLEDVKESDVMDTVVAAKLVDHQGKALSRTVNWPEPFKYFKFPEETSIDLRVELSTETGEITLEASRPVKGLVLWVNDDSKLMDNFLDLVPGEKIMVEIQGATDKTRLSWSHYGTLRSQRCV
ncbi:hypothetical protein JCM5350_007106 [Sporobolomyces pararoseus]